VRHKTAPSVEQQAAANCHRPTTNHQPPTFPQLRPTARFSPFFFPAEPAISSGIAAQSLRKISFAFLDEIRVQMLRKTSG
jgi:hypothetical protein